MHKEMLEKCAIRSERKKERQAEERVETKALVKKLVRYSRESK